MGVEAIVQILSSDNNAIGTGFVFDSDTEGCRVVTCSHVVSACGEGALLVDGYEAELEVDFKSEGLDLAIVQVKGLQRIALPIRDQHSSKVKLYGYTHFNTKLRHNIKGEWMEHVEAKYNVALSGEGETIDSIRLSSSHKISNGYSGSPVICEIEGVVVGMVALEVSGNSTESYTNYAISAKHLLQKCMPSPDVATPSLFVTEVFDTLNQNRLVVLFSQDFTDITRHQAELKAKAQTKFGKGFHHFSVPSFVDEEALYFQTLAMSCGLESTIDSPGMWKMAMQSKLQESQARVMLLVTDIENGNVEFDKQFSLIVRSLVSEFPHFSVLFIGKKDLAYLVYGENSLSPLNTAKELFFPDSILEVDEDLIEQQFLSLGKHRKSICKHLTKETLGRHKTWSFNEAINALFWKNLLVKQGRHFAWRDDLTKSIGREVFECDGDVV